MDVLKYRRGQVWMLNSKSNYNGSVQGGTRPCVIISNDIGNMTSNVVMVLKITSATKYCRSVNVRFTNINNETNYILCNQVETVNKSDLDRYLYSLSDDLMKLVERSYLIASGMESYVGNINSTLSNIENILTSMSVIKANELHNTSDDETVIKNIADKLMDLYIKMSEYYDMTSEEIKGNINPLIDYRERQKLGINNKYNITEDTDKIIPTKKPKGFWTDDKARELLRDYESISLNDIVNKWNFKDNTSAYQVIYRIKNKYKNKE